VIFELEVRERPDGKCWLIALWYGVPVSRALINAETGELLDQAWCDAEGRTRSWSATQSHA
jgi:hypothetical protein